MMFNWYGNKLKRSLKLMVLFLSILILIQVFLYTNSYHKEDAKRIAVHEFGEWVAYHKYFEYDFSKEERDEHQACYIQQYQPFDPSLLKYVKKLPPLKCDTQIQITYIDENGLLKFDEEGLKKSGRKKNQLRCTYTEILRNNLNKEDTYKYSKPKVFRGQVNVKHIDFIRVICKNLRGSEVYHNFHLHIRDLPNESFKMDDNKYNVYLFGIDSLSRMQAMRQIPKTYTYLNEDLKTYIMRGYNKVGRNTFPNVGSFLTGSNPYNDPPLYRPRREDKKPYDPWPFMWKNFSEHGYRTMFAEEDPMHNVFHDLSSGFYKQPTDYYCRHFWKALEDRQKKTNDSRYCFGDKPKHTLFMTYPYRLVKKLHGKVPFWALSYLTEISHGHQNTVGMADDDIYDFLKKIHDERLLKNTFFIFFSDHGERTDTIRTTYIGGVEDKMPLIAILPPKRFQDSQAEAMRNLKKNEKRLTNAYDVYCTLMDVLKLSLDPKHKLGHFRSLTGISLFSEIPQNRTCKTAGIADEFCACLTEERVPTNTSLVTRSAEVIVAKINQMLTSNNESSSLCAKLSLSEIVDAHSVFESISSKGSKFRVKIKTEPSYGLFEGVVSISGQRNKIFKVTNNIDRINRYGNQSICIHDQILREFCSCL